MYKSNLFLLNLITFITSFTFAQSTCNGYAELCDVPYHKISHIINHNAYGYVANPAANQLCPIPSQLNDGVRGLKLSAVPAANATRVGTDADSILLCHSSCSLLNAGPAKDTLSLIKEWLDNNPNEVVTIMWNNVGSFKPIAFKAAYDAANLTDYSFVQKHSNYTWPTLGEIIRSGKRLITFVDEGVYEEPIDWLLPEWSFIFETPYDNRNESSFNCVIDRPIEVDNPKKYMYVMNHFIYGVIPLGSLDIEIPQMLTSNVTNSDSLLRHARNCTDVFGRKPSFIEVDFYNLGDTLKNVAILNNVSYIQPAQLQCDAYQAKLQQEKKASIANSQYHYYIYLISFVVLLFV